MFSYNPNKYKSHSYRNNQYKINNNISINIKKGAYICSVKQNKTNDMKTTSATIGECVKVEILKHGVWVNCKKGEVVGIDTDKNKIKVRIDGRAYWYAETNVNAVTKAEDVKKENAVKNFSKEVHKAGARYNLFKHGGSWIFTREIDKTEDGETYISRTENKIINADRSIDCLLTGKCSKSIFAYMKLRNRIDSIFGVDISE